MQQVMFIMRIIGPPQPNAVASFGAMPATGWTAPASSPRLLHRSLAINVQRPYTSTRRRRQGAVAKIWHDMQEGFSFIIHHAALLFVILALATGMFIMGCFRTADRRLCSRFHPRRQHIYGWASAMNRHRHPHRH